MEKNDRSIARLVSCAWAAGMLAACSSTPGSSGDSPTTRDGGARDTMIAMQIATSTAAHPDMSVHPDTQKSWISPELSTDKTRARPVVFVSDPGVDDLYIFRLPTLKYVGKVTGLNDPQGECTDNSGDVWVANTKAFQTLEYSHNGELKSTLGDPIGDPASCAWDATTGNLAVTDIIGQGSNTPAIEIYQHATGTPTQYRNPDVIRYYSAGYDDEGNLFVDGQDSGGSFVLSELPKGGAQARTIQIIGGTIYVPGMVQWYAPSGYLAVGDQECGGTPVSCIYWVSVQHSSGSITGKTRLNNYLGKHACQVVEGYLYHSQIVGSDYGPCRGVSTATLYAWPYPKGGNPAAYNSSILSNPVGAAVSK